METLTKPVQIAPNLAAGVLIDGHWITVNYAYNPGSEGRTRYQWEIIFPGGDSATGDDLQSGCQGGNLTEGLTSFLSFLSACGESLRYQEYSGRAGDNAELFTDPRVLEFCRRYGEECACLEFEIQEAADDE